MQADLNHGLKQLNLFGFEPLVQIQGPNAVDTWDDMDMYLTVRKSLSELGTMEDIILHGTAQAFGAEVALLMSETSDIWADYANPTELIGRTGTAGTAQRALYIALRHLQQPVDVIIEEDCEDPSVLANYSSVFISEVCGKNVCARCFAKKKSELQRDLDLAYLFIAHDLAVVRHIADRIHVMYLGRIVEEGTAADIFERPAPPYTKTLLAAMPGARRLLAPESRPLESQPGEELVPSGDVPSALDPPEGCPFHPRCAFAEERCRLAYPERRELSASHVAACHLLDPDESPPSEPG